MKIELKFKNDLQATENFIWVNHDDFIITFLPSCDELLSIEFSNSGVRVGYVLESEQHITMNINIDEYNTWVDKLHKNSKMKLNYKSKLYELTDGGDPMDCCQDCAFQQCTGCPNTDNTSTLCSSRFNVTNKIWKEVKIMNKQTMVFGKPMYTVDEVLSARCSVLRTSLETPTQVGEIAQYLKLWSDPEYKKYLDLKAKFEVNND
jgi:hypothetical protein